MLQNLFTTSNTDYVYALSSAYNILAERTDEAKASEKAVVVFISDGNPYSMTGTSSWSGTIGSFFNPFEHIKELRDAITTQPSAYQSHDVKQSYITQTGLPDGLGAEFVAASYMVDKPDSKILANLVTAPELYLKITSDSRSAQGALKDALLKMPIFPGGREVVLRDTISK